MIENESIRQKYKKYENCENITHFQQILIDFNIKKKISNLKQPSPLEHMSNLKMLYAHTSNSSERKNSSKASKKNILITRAH